MSSLSVEERIESRLNKRLNRIISDNKELDRRNIDVNIRLNNLIDEVNILKSAGLRTCTTKIVTFDKYFKIRARYRNLIEAFRKSNELNSMLKKVVGQLRHKLYEERFIFCLMKMSWEKYRNRVDNAKFRIYHKLKRSNRHEYFLIHRDLVEKLNKFK